MAQGPQLVSPSSALPLFLLFSDIARDTKTEFNEPKSRVDLSLALLEQDLGMELKLWMKNITDEDLNIDPTQFENTQTLVGIQYPGREYGVTASYTF